MSLSALLSKISLSGEALFSRSSTRCPSSGFSVLRRMIGRSQVNSRELYLHFSRVPELALRSCTLRLSGAALPFCLSVPSPLCVLVTLLTRVFPFISVAVKLACKPLFLFLFSPCVQFASCSSCLDSHIFYFWFFASRYPMNFFLYRCAGPLPVA